ncbi:MAG: hypothetical protein Q7U11_24220 [Phenylobacterium sp.]|uniref:Uncharacterized protein n=1 Tax=Phenylobacterium ferrooxidans TaxID=2982689 RepID=A0ABW6D216_9CAUL|nr:hypothetical protein [Phenylobacterium sp.]MDO8297174.1 hypothetical protein [Caulobacter sp.]MDO9249578.1 hypothetical protein [Phenylobacterium sp.]MDP2008839.1 hypothetical protein [Phenylobacterium sp.]MDP3632504.1 hypothetical protein [Phenylobacterium sp.]MDP3866990.1 hypothetical protein [Phenylobacterium sp.]
MVILLKTKVATTSRNGAAAKAGLCSGILREGQAERALTGHFVP